MRTKQQHSATTKAIAPNSNGHIRVAVLLVMLLAVAGSCFAVERFQIDSGTNPDYLPYYLDTLVPKDISTWNYQIARPVRPLLISGDQDRPSSSILYSQNVRPQSSGSSRFTTYSYDPGWQVGVEYPVPYTILRWMIHHDSSSGARTIMHTGRNRDGVHVGKLVFEDDSVSFVSKLLMRRDENIEPDDWVPGANIYRIADYDLDGHPEVFVYVSDNPKPRRLFCIDLITLETEWELDVASPIVDLKLIEDSVDARVILIASNPCNMVSDSNFADWFQYFAVLNNSGEMLNKRIIGNTYEHGIGLCAAPEPNMFYLAHAFDYPDSTSIPDSVDSYHHISLIDSDGKIHKSVTHKHKPVQIALVPFGDNGLPHLWVRSLNGSVRVYTLGLEEVAYCGNTKIGVFLGEISISEEAEPVLVFSDGLYDRDFTKILHFPIYALSVTPLAFDPLGHTTDIVVGGVGSFNIGRITSRSQVELASAFYHNNQVYILAGMFGLLVGLISTNVFRRRAKSNLNTIAKQKSELEQTHHDLIEAQQKLIAAEKYKQAKDIAGGFAHEIRNALFPADGLLGKLRRFEDLSTVDPDRLKNYLKDSQKAVNRAVDITELITQYTKLDSQHVPEPVQLRKVLDEIADANKLRLQEQGVSIEITCPTKIEVIANHRQLYMVFNNIVLNALDALEKRANPTILVSVDIAGKAGVTIADNGTGIPTDKIDRVFETFYSTKPDRGTGLGLALARKIVEMYDGDIAVESKENHGTTFTVTLPLHN